MCEVLGRGIATVCYVINPEIVVLGGSAMAEHRFLMPRIRAAMEKYMIEPLTVNTFIASAAHGYLAGMLGAYYHFLLMRKS
ncbi:MAG: ROK family protein [Lachnospiraceae bacterium]|nr:ROK family protein [Lachnospiraceae bacterium]